MKKGILCILLSILLLLPMFTACEKEADLTGTEAAVYTLYTICEEGTQEDDIRKVELALNRILYYRLGVILKLELVTEDKYDQLIEEKFEEMTEYQEALKNGDIKTEDTELTTGDDILKMLDNNEDIPLKQPRLDIFLVRGYDKYYELATNGDITALDEKLSNEAKALKSNIHSTLFDATKVSNKVYGVPINNVIGEYTYFVLDNELLSKYEVNPSTITTIEDLSDYFAKIKADPANSDIVPLKNAVSSTKFSYLVEEGFPAIADEDHVVSEAYSSAQLKNYFSMLARYNKLGYLGSDSDPEDTRYAVRIESGDKAELEVKYENCTCVLYSAPLATNETAVNNLLCVSKFVVSNELTDVMKIVTALNTDADLMNLLTYGVENEHYTLTDNNQVDRLNQNYMMNPAYIGNAFITKTLAGESEDKWSASIKQNQDAIVSPSLGFTASPYKFTYKDEDGNDAFIYEPDYYGKISEVVNKYYPSLLNGEVDFDYDEIFAASQDEVYEKIESDLKIHYEDNIYRPMFVEETQAAVVDEMYDELLATAEKNTMSECTKRVRDDLLYNLKNKYKEKNPQATDDELTAMAEADLTDEMIETELNKRYSEAYIANEIQEWYDSLLETEIESRIDAMSTSNEYISGLNKLINSDRFKNELEALKAVAMNTEIFSKVDEKISNIITETIINPMMEEINLELEALVNTFFEENKETLNFTTVDDVLKQIGYLVAVEVETEVSDDEEPAEPVYEPKYDSWFKFVYNDKIVTPYNAIFGSDAA